MPVLSPKSRDFLGSIGLGLGAGPTLGNTSARMDRFMGGGGWKINICMARSVTIGCMNAVVLYGKRGVGL